ncbi:hypothetical protein CBS101457_005312 [Exobasidium rhododendri]|nr:hypothetical protein CBS101457_005312 [Exobasidium rhododendri]
MAGVSNDAARCKAGNNFGPVVETDLPSYEAYIPPFDSSSIQLEGKEDPRNWSSSMKWYTTAVISLMGFISPLGSSILVPGGEFLDRDMHLHSRTLSLLPVSLFVLGLGVGPFFLAPASELKGRQPIYLISSVVFVLLNVGCALVDTFPSLLVLRFLAGAAGSTGPSLGAGSIGDMFSPRDRGRAQSLYGLGPLLGPVCGTIAGGWIAQGSHNWHWLMWTLAILSGVITIIVLVSLRETYGPVLLQRKVKKMTRLHLEELTQMTPANEQEKKAWEEHYQQVEKLVKPSNAIALERLPPRVSKFVSPIIPSKVLLVKLRLALSRPFRLLFGNPICAIFSLYMGYIYGIIFLFITQHPLLFQRRDDPEEPSPQRLPTYGFSEGIASLSYIGLGLGFIVAAIINTLLQDTIYARLVLSQGKIGWFLFLDRDEIVERVTQIKSNKAEEDDKEKQTTCVVVDQEKNAGRSSPATAEPKVASGSSKASDNAKLSDNDVKITPTTATRPAPPTLMPQQQQQPTPPVGKGRPEYRLPLCFVGMIILPCGLLLFGWTAAARVHFMIPLIGSFLVGVGSILPFQSILVYLVDAFIPYSASATACAVLVRCVLAAAFPLFAQQMFVAIGYGWGSTVLAVVSLLGLPVPIILYLHGEKIRTRFKFNG